MEFQGTQPAFKLTSLVKTK